MHEHNYYAAPTAKVHDGFAHASVGWSGVLASRASRLAAAFLDMFVLAILGFAFFGLTFLTQSDFTVFGTVVLLLGLIAIMVINIYLLYTNGQTIGKKLMGIKIVRSDLENPASLSRIIFLRIIAVQLIGMIPLFGSFFILANYLWIFGEQQRCLHDHIADTAVIVDQPEAEPQPEIGTGFSAPW